MIQRSNVLGVGISPLDLTLAVSTILAASKRPGFCGYVTVTGVHGVMECQRDSNLKDIHNQSFLSVPDGMPMVWVGKMNGFDKIGRVYGPDLMLKISSETATTAQGHIYFGGGEGICDLLSTKMKERFPGLRIVGEITPPFRPLTQEEEAALAESIRQTRPHFLWVGLSTPKQERFMHSFLTRFPDITNGWDHGLIMLGVGAAFDFHAGKVSQAPSWMQKRGMEWFYRLIMEPKRLWKRYFFNNPAFLKNIFLQLAELKKF
jgi:N-acetylglucosaminyldiphosphoundecaprenol N-acetyl-beta-D-mannosaminyltransferase